MKILIFTALLSGMILVAGAQPPKKMTPKEKEETLRELELEYRIETGQMFQFEESAPQQVQTLPWEAWAAEHKDAGKRIGKLLRSFKNITLEAVEDEPDACQITFRTHNREKDRFDSYASVGFSNDFGMDDDGNRIGFRQELSAFCNLVTEIGLHLTTAKDKPVYIAPKQNAYAMVSHRVDNEGAGESSIGLKLPLTAAYSEINDGYIDVRLYGPTEYAWAKVSTRETGQELSLGGVRLRIEKIDDKGFVISTTEEDAERLEHLKYLYQRSDSIWKPTFTMWTKGPLKKMMNKQALTDLSFHEWLRQKGVDPDRLEETLANFTDDTEEETDTIQGMRFDSGMTGDYILLYMPINVTETEPIATARVFVPGADKQTVILINEAQQAKLLGKLVSGDMFTMAIDKFEYPAVKGAPARLKSGCSLSAAERDALLAPNDVISYAMGVVQADKLMKDERQNNITAVFFTPEEQEPLIEWFGKGISAGKELHLQTIKEEGAKADSIGIAQGKAFRYGVEAFQLYCSCAARDVVESDSMRVSGKRFDVNEAVQGFKDYLQRHLKMGIQYATTILSQRAAAVKDLGERKAANGLNDDDTDYLTDFQIASGVNPQTGNPEMLQTALSRHIRTPQEASMQGLTGKVMAEAVIEADGSINKVQIISSPHQILSEAATDGLYRLHCRPAMAGQVAVAMKVSIPIFFQ